MDLEPHQQDAAYMQAHQGKLWRTVEHVAPIEYQAVIQDLVLVSEYLAA